MKQKRGSIQSYGSISNVEGYEPIPDGNSDYEEDDDINGNCKYAIMKFPRYRRYHEIRSFFCSEVEILRFWAIQGKCKCHHMRKFSFTSFFGAFYINSLK